GPSSHRPKYVYPSCTESRAMPVVDTLITSLYLYVLAFGDDSANATSRDEEVRTGLLGAALFGTSAYFGFTRTERCRVDHGRFVDEEKQRPPLRAGPGVEGQTCHPHFGCEAGLSC